MGRTNSYTKSAARRAGYRSGLEVGTGEQLEELGIAFEYESEACKFKYWTKVTNGGCITRDGNEHLLGKEFTVVQFRNYTCDFMVMKKDGQPMFIETKGRFTGKDRVKHQQLKKLYPDVDIRIIFQNDGRVSPKTTYSQWATKQEVTHHCLSYKERKAGKYIPEEWLQECIQ